MVTRMLFPVGGCNPLGIVEQGGCQMVRFLQHPPRPHRLTVRTLDFHSKNRSSILRGGTILKRILGELACSRKALWILSRQAEERYVCVSIWYRLGMIHSLVGTEGVGTTAPTGRSRGGGIRHHIEAHCCLYVG